eukprot:5144602-Prymnesium_polylepis.3
MATAQECGRGKHQAISIDGRCRSVAGERLKKCRSPQRRCVRAVMSVRTQHRSGALHAMTYRTCEMFPGSSFGSGVFP